MKNKIAFKEHRMSPEGQFPYTFCYDVDTNFGPRDKRFTLARCKFCNKFFSFAGQLEKKYYRCPHHPKEELDKLLENFDKELKN